MSRSMSRPNSYLSCFMYRVLLKYLLLIVALASMMWLGSTTLVDSHVCPRCLRATILSSLLTLRLVNAFLRFPTLVWNLMFVFLSSGTLKTGSFFNIFTTPLLIVLPV